MNVAELVAWLETFPPNAPVYPDRICVEVRQPEGYSRLFFNYKMTDTGVEFVKVRQ